MHLGMKKWGPYAFGAHLNAFGDGMHFSELRECERQSNSVQNKFPLW